MALFYPSNIPRKYSYWEGNIFRSIYSNMRGFWLVQKGRAYRCDEHGTILTKEQCLYGTSDDLVMRNLRDTDPDFLWRDMNAGLYPVLDTFNVQKQFEYRNGGNTDEQWAIKAKIADDERARRLAEYEALPQIEKDLRNFDWSYSYSDDYRAARSAAYQASKLLPQLDLLPQDQRDALIAKYSSCGVDYKEMTHMVSFYAGHIYDVNKEKERREIEKAKSIPHLMED